MNDSNIKLSSQEEIRFRDLTDRILNQYSQPNILTDSDKKEYFELLHKLGLSSQLQREDLKNNETIKVLISSFTFLSIYILLVGIPIGIALLLNVSSIYIVFIIVVATSLSIISVGFLMGKVSWGSLIIMITPILVMGIALYFLS